LAGPASRGFWPESRPPERLLAAGRTPEGGRSRRAKQPPSPQPLERGPYLGAHPAAPPARPARGAPRRWKPPSGGFRGGPGGVSPPQTSAPKPRR